MASGHPLVVVAKFSILVVGVVSEFVVQKGRPFLSDSKGTGATM